MLETIATILVGMGLMFYGMEKLSAETKQLTGRRLRMLLGKWTSKKSVGMLFGVISGAVTHSGSSASIIISNLVSSRLISIRNAFPILASANVGTVAIVFMFAINLKLGIMYMLGISAIVYSLNKKASKHPLIKVLFGISLLLFGFHELEAGAEHILETEALNHWLSSIQGYLYFSILLFVLGIVLRLLTQSSSSVAVLVISLGHAGILSETHVLFMVAGAPIGAALAMILESRHIKGSTKQIPAFQFLFEVLGSIIFIAILLLELATGIPMIKKFISLLSVNTPEYVAFALLIIRLLSFITVTVFSKAISGILEKMFPPIKEETLASPKFIYDQAIEDPDTAIDLIEKESSRIMSRFPSYLENIRLEHETAEVIDIKTLHDATTKLGKYTESFIRDMFNQNVSTEVSEKLLKIQNQHGIIMLMEENMFNMVKEVMENPVPEDLYRLRLNIIESLHAVLSTCTDDMTSEGFSIEHLISMTSDKGSLMEKIRGKYLSGYEDPTGNIRKTMMYVTDLFQRIIWLVNKWALSR